VRGGEGEGKRPRGKEFERERVREGSEAIQSLTPFKASHHSKLTPFKDQQTRNNDEISRQLL
jgi:hypothetical protein